MITLSYYRDEGQLKRALSVLKTRASGHDSATREFAIDSSGFSINDAVIAGRDLP